MGRSSVISTPWMARRPACCALLLEFDGAVHGVQVGQGQGGKAEIGRARDQLGGRVGAAEQGIVAVDVQMDHGGTIGEENTKVNDWGWEIAFCGLGS